MFKNLFKKKIRDQLISVVEYPDFYLFQTLYKIETGLWKITDIITIVKKDTTSENIGSLILYHLNESKNVKEKEFNFKSLYENYKNKTKLNSLKKQMTNSKLIHISRNGENIEFIPTKNGGTKGNNKGYFELTDKKISTSNPDFNNLSKIFFEAFILSE